MSDINPAGTYRPQYRARWRAAVRWLDRWPRLKRVLAELIRRQLRRVFEPTLVTTERVVEYPFVFQELGERKGTVLDIGSCSSGFPIALASRGYRTLAFDFVRYELKHPLLIVLRGDATRLPFASRSLDIVIAVSVIEHVGLGHYGDPREDDGDRRVVQEIARVLAVDGRALITVPFGRERTDRFQRVYSPGRLTDLLRPLSVVKIEYAATRSGLWAPAPEKEAAEADWTERRAVALVAATVPR